MVNHGRITIEFPGHGTFACSLTSATLKARYQSRSKLAHEIVALWPELFKTDNPRFDYDRFVAAIGLEAA